MKISRLPLSLTIASTMLCAPAIAQTRYCIGGDLDHMSIAQKNACNAKVQAVRQAVAAFGAPRDWHFVVVCGEDGWKGYTDFTMREEAALDDASADTDLEQHETFLRGDRLSSDGGLQRVVAHEVAGIVLKSKDELAIQKQVNLWMGETETRQGF